MSHKKSNTKKKHYVRTRKIHKKIQHLNRISRRCRRGGMLNVMRRGIRLTGKKLGEAYLENTVDNTFEQSHYTPSGPPKFDPRMHSVVYSKSARQNVRSPATRQSRAYPNNFGSPRSGSYAENRIIMSPVTNKPRTPTIMNTPSTTALTTINRSMSPSTIDSPDFDDIQQYIGRFGLSDITTKTPARNNRLTTVSSNLLSKFNAL